MLSASLLSIIYFMLLLTTAQAGPITRSKAGLAWPGRLPASLSAPFSRPGTTLSWHWNWSPAPSLGGTQPGQFAATIYKATTDTSAIPGDCPVLGFNEPDGCQAGTQSCMPDLAVTLNAWIAKAVPLIRQGRRVGSPAPAGATVTYLAKFFAACDARPDCLRPSFITMHAYVTTAAALKEYVTSVHTAFGMPIWLTEFSCHSFGGQPQPTSDQQVHDFMGTTTKWLDAQPFIERYSWLGAGQAYDMHGVNDYCRLQRDDGSLTALGWQYVFKRHS